MLPRLLPLVVLAMACRGGAGDDGTGSDDKTDVVPIEESETGDTGISDSDDGIEDATPLALDEDAAGVIQPAGDVDWYSYAALGPTWVRIDTTTQGDRTYNLDTVVAIYDPDGALYAYMNDHAVGAVSGYDTVLYAYLDRPGRWGITVEDVTTFYTDRYGPDDWRGGSDYTYTVGVSDFSGQTSEADGQDDPSVGVDLESGASIFAVGVNIEEAGDADWLAVHTAVDGQPLEVWGAYGNVGSELSPEVSLYAADGTLLAQKVDVGPGGYLSYFDPTAGDYLVAVTDAVGAGGESSWFVAFLRTYDDDFPSPFFGDTDYVAEVEPDDSEADAIFAPVAVGDLNGMPYDVVAVRGTIGQPGDTDWYGIRANDAADQVSVRCFTQEFGSLLDLAVTVTTADGQELAHETLAGSNYYYVLDVPVGAPGDVFVKIEAEDGLGSPASYYRCRLLMAEFDIP